MMLEAKAVGPIVLVDGSYFIFRRFFATLKWYKFRDPDVRSDTCMGVEEFRNAILKHTLADIQDLRKRWAVQPEGKRRASRKDWEDVSVWFAVDCHRAEIWRSALVPDYKGTRERNAMMDPGCFQALYELLRDQLPLLEVDGLEADDIIALTHRRLRDRGYTGKIVCITNDNDYLQLLDEHTELYNLEKKDLRQRSCGDPRKDLLVKILVGDKSDNIRPVREKLTEKRVKDLLPLAEEEILQALTLNGDEMARFELNRKLIDFGHIPTDLVEKYNGCYDIAIL